MVSAGCGREGPVQPGSGWGLGDLCSDSRPSWAGGPTPCPGGLSSSTLPSDRCRRETAIPASSVQRPAQLLLWAWPGSLSWELFLLCVGQEVLSAPRTPGLSLASALSYKPAAGLEFGASPDLWAPCVSGRGRGPAGGAFKYAPSPPRSGVGLPPRWSWCSDAGSVIKTVQLLSCGFWPLAVGKPAGPW